MNARETLRQIGALTQQLIATNLSLEQNFPSLEARPSAGSEIGFASSQSISVALKAGAYQKIYDLMSASRLFNFKLIDGALVQMAYSFKRDVLVSHRLAYFPSPKLLSFDEAPDLYLEEELYADIVGDNLVRFPIRFDYNEDASMHVDIHHPKSHLTLGQYPNCRIPVSAPLSPCLFMEFVMRNFYHLAFREHEQAITYTCDPIEESISVNESAIFHIALP
jgi:hypothetical protein